MRIFFYITERASSCLLERRNFEKIDLKRVTSLDTSNKCKVEVKWTDAYPIHMCDMSRHFTAERRQSNE